MGGERKKQGREEVRFEALRRPSSAARRTTLSTLAKLILMSVWHDYRPAHGGMSVRFVHSFICLHAYSMTITDSGQTAVARCLGLGGCWSTTRGQCCIFLMIIRTVCPRFCPVWRPAPTWSETTHRNHPLTRLTSHISAYDLLHSHSLTLSRPETPPPKLLSLWQAHVIPCFFTINTEEWNIREDKQGSDRKRRIKEGRETESKHEGRP